MSPYPRCGPRYVNMISNLYGFRTVQHVVYAYVAMLPYRDCVLAGARNNHSVFDERIVPDAAIMQQGARADDCASADGDAGTEGRLRADFSGIADPDAIANLDCLEDGCVGADANAIADGYGREENGSTLDANAGAAEH